MRRYFFGLVVSCAAVWADVGYVLNADSQSLSVIDSTTLKVTETIAIKGNGLPIYIGVSPDHAKLMAGGTLEPLNIVDLSTKEVVKTVSGSVTGDPLFTQDGSFAYVPMGGSVLEVNCSTCETELHPAVENVAGVAFAENGGWAANAEGKVSTFPAKVGKAPGNPSGSNVLQVCAKSQIVYSAGNSEVYLTLPDGQTLPPIPVGKGPYQLLVSPDSSMLFVLNRGENSVSVITTETHQKVTDITVGAEPSKMVMTPDGALLLVVNTKGNTLSIIDVEDERNVIDYPVGTVPEAVAISPDGQTIMVTNLQDDTVTLLRYTGSTIQFLGTVEVGTNPYGCAF